MYWQALMSTGLTRPLCDDMHVCHAHHHHLMWGVNK